MKKLLALVLALVMTMSLAVVSTNAATKYSDASDIKEGKYSQAIDVMTAIGVLGGDVTDGKTTFRPNDTLKRAEGAKIIAYLMLGNNAAEQIKGGTKFTDVPASYWGAGYIEYLAVEGVVGGVGDNRFDPDGPLTTAAFTKMLLGALGYDATIEGLGGPDWMINVQKLAKQVGLFDGNKEAVASADITRQEAALYGFNAIKSPLVEYENKGSTIAVNGATVTFGAGKAQYRVNTGKSIARYNQIDNKLTNDIDRSQIVEFAEEYYDKLNLKGNDDHDAFDRPADIWTFDGKKIGEYSKEPDLLYTKTVTLGDIYKDLGLTKAVWPTADGSVNGASLFFEDGVALNVANAKLEKESATKIGGNGAELYVYYDEGIVRICEVNWYVGDITGTYSATSAKDAYVDIAGRGDNAISGTKSNVDFKVDDVVIYTACLDDNKVDIQDIQKAEVVKGKLDNFVMVGFEGLNLSATGSVTIAGKKYAYAAAVANTPDGSFIKNGVELEVVLDKYGYAIDVGDYGVQNYAVVVKASGVGGAFTSDNVVELLLTDGTTTGAVYLSGDHPAGLMYTTHSTVDSADDTYGRSTMNFTGVGTVTPVGANGIRVGDIVTYTINSSGKYTLILKKHGNEWNNNSGVRKDIVTNGTSNLDAVANTFNFGGAAISYPNDYKANGKTVFLIKDNSGNYHSYEGIKEVPTIRANAMGAYAPYIGLGDGVGTNCMLLNSYASQKAAGAAGRTYGDTKTSAAAQIVYVDLNDSAVLYNNDAVFVRVSSKYNKTVNSNGDVYYAVEAIVNGKHYTDDDPLKLDVGSYEDALNEVITRQNRAEGFVLFKGMTMNSKNIATLADLQGTVAGYPARGSAAVKQGVIGLGDNFAAENIQYLSYTKDVSVWYINDQNEIAPSNIASIPNSSAARPVRVWWSVNASNDVNYIFWTDKYNVNAVVATATYNATGTLPTFAELQASLNANTVVEITNVGITGYTLPIDLATGKTLNVPTGTTLVVYYGASGGARGDLIVPDYGTTPVMLINGSVLADDIEVNGRVNIETGAVLSAAGALNITSTGHVKTNGRVYINGANPSTINGDSLEVRGGLARFVAAVKFLGGFRMSGTKTVVSFLSMVTMTKTATVNISEGTFSVQDKVVMEEGSSMVIADAAFVAQSLEMSKDTTVNVSGTSATFAPAKVVDKSGDNSAKIKLAEDVIPVASIPVEDESGAAATGVISGGNTSVPAKTAYSVTLVLPEAGKTQTNSYAAELANATEATKKPSSAQVTVTITGTRGSKDLSEVYRTSSDTSAVYVQVGDTFVYEVTLNNTLGTNDSFVVNANGVVKDENKSTREKFVGTYTVTAN